MKSVIAKNMGRASPSSPESAEAELYAQFQLMFPICHAVSGKLTWTHYRTLITCESMIKPME